MTDPSLAAAAREAYGAAMSTAFLGATAGVLAAAVLALLLLRTCRPADAPATGEPRTLVAA